MAIRDLVARRRLNATSVMVVAPSFSRAEAAALAALNAGETRVAIGLHLTLTAPLKPLTADYAPLADGAFLPVATTLRLAMQQRLDVAAITREFRAQFEAFAAAFGRPPDFVDGHQHVQLFPQVRQAALETTSWIAPAAWVRQCGASVPLHRRLTDPERPADRLAQPRIPRARREPRHLDQSGLRRHLYVSGECGFRRDLPGFPRRSAGGRPGDVPSGPCRCRTRAARPAHHPAGEQEYAYFCGDEFAALLEKRGFDAELTGARPATTFHACAISRAYWGPLYHPAPRGAPEEDDMTPQERQLMAELFNRLASLENAPRDPDAEAMIREGFRRAPNAAYALVQTVLVQDEALKAANNRIQEYEQQFGGPQPPQPQEPRGFLDSMRESIFGREEPRGSVPRVPQAGWRPLAARRPRRKPIRGARGQGYGDQGCGQPGAGQPGYGQTGLRRSRATRG